MKKQFLALTLISAFTVTMVQASMTTETDAKAVASAIDNNRPTELNKINETNPELLTQTNFMGTYGAHRNNFDLTPLQYAVFYGKSTAVINKLLSFPRVKNDINKEDINGSSAVMMAVESTTLTPVEKVRIIRLLHKNGANLAMKNHYGLTPMDSAKRQKQESVIKILEKLMKK